MKELKRTETIEKIIGYEADDGTQFDSKEECEKYEKSALGVVYERFKKLIVKKYVECDVFTNYGYGSEEYEYFLIDIKNINDLNVYNHFLQLTESKENIIDESYIGKRILVSAGFEYDDWKHRTLYVNGTIDDMVAKFTKDMEKVFVDKKGDTNETK